MAYAILRTAKLKGAGSIGGSIAHALREREVPNADPERTKDNEVLIPYDAEKTRNDIESARTRSDNVEMVEVVMTTSPEWMDAATDEQKKEFGQVINLLKTTAEEKVMSIQEGLENQQESKGIYGDLTAI